MEDLFVKFRAWLARSKTQLTSLVPRPSPAEKDERDKALKQAQVKQATCTCSMYTCMYMCIKLYDLIRVLPVKYLMKYKLFTTVKPKYAAT